MITVSPPSSSCLGTDQSFHGELKAEHLTRLRHWGWDTTRICFDAFTLHKRRWQPLNASTQDALGQLPAIGHFSFHSLSRIVAFQKRIKHPKVRMNPLHLRSLIQEQILRALGCHILLVLVCFIPLKYETCRLLFKMRMCVAVVHCRQLDPVSRIWLWWVQTWSRTDVSMPSKLLTRWLPWWK